TMHGRMSKLRRSLSRSVLQLHAIHALSRSHNHLNSDAYESRQNAPNEDLIHKFASPSTFNQFKEIVQGNSENLREIINILDEKSTLDANYSKSLHKLAARLHKITQKATCEIDNGWTSAAEQFDMQATIHSNLSSALSDDIVQPLRAIQINEERSVRASSLFVEKQLKRLKEKKADVARAKRLAYTAAKDLERLEQTADTDKTNQNKYPPRRKKLQDAAKKSEDAYVFESIDLEKMREMTEKVLQRAVAGLEGIEMERLAHSQTALGRLHRKIEQLGPSLTQMFTRQTNNLDVAIHSSPSSFLQSLSPSQTPSNNVMLTDTFAENFAEVMKMERRRESLGRLAGLLDAELQRMYALARVEDVRSQQISLVEYVEYLYYKVGESLSSLEGRSSTSSHRLNTFQHRLKDKQGLPQTILVLPLTEGADTVTLPGLSSPSLPASSPISSPIQSDCNDTYEEYEKISDEGFYNSNSRQSTVIDDPSLSEEDKKVCRVIYDFKPQNEEEIEIRAGESVLIESRLGPDWCYGRVITPLGRSLPPQQTMGRFPTTYISMQEASIFL
ncbi:hypothetical protein PFISCL1PPCAC_10265, partial [Pristionchus fissidentatus]